MNIIKKTQIEKLPTTYNLHVKNNHNYVANDVVVANCHQIKATVLLDLLTGELNKIPIRWGVTGTIPKEEFEKRSLQVAIGEVLGYIKASELQEKGVLSNCHVNIKQYIDHVEFKLYQDELKYLLGTTNRLEHIANFIKTLRSSGNTLVLIDRIEAGKLLVENIEGANFVNGAMKSTTRKGHYNDIATGDNQVLVATYGVASTGIDLPRIFNLVLIEPGKSFIKVIQSIGRGLRKANDKDSVMIYDITSTCKFSKRHLSKRKIFYQEAAYPFSIQKIDWQSGNTNISN